MKCLWLMPVAMALWATPPRDISGKVVDAQTGASIPRVRVKITSFSSSTVTRQEITVLTGDDGGFQFTNLPEGNVVVTCERTGYLPHSEAPRNNEEEKLTIRLVPQAVIEGTVVDDAGVGVPFVNVQIYRRVVIEGRRQAQAASSPQTDDRGVFRVARLDAGSYTIGVVATGLRRSKLAYPLVFYPNSPDLAGAQYLQLRAGQEEQVRIRLPQPVAGREIRGVIVPPVENVNLGLRPADAAPGMFPGHEPQFDPKKGEFRFKLVTPGAYVIEARAAVVGDWRGGGATVKLTVGDEDVTGVRIDLRHEITLKGKLRLEGPATFPLAATRVELRSPSGQVGPVIQEDGSFEIRDLHADTYRLVVTRPDAYLRSAWQSGMDVARDGIIISDDSMPAPLDIVLAAPGGTVEGDVTARDVSPQDLLAVVLLRASGDSMVLEAQGLIGDLNGGTLSLNGSALSRMNIGGRLVFMRSPRKDGDNRHFVMPGIAPGDYLVFAWPAQAEVAYAEPEFSKQYGEFGKPVTVKDGEKVSVTIDRVLRP